MGGLGRRRRAAGRTPTIRRRATAARLRVCRPACSSGNGAATVLWLVFPAVGLTLIFLSPSSTCAIGVHWRLSRLATLLWTAALTPHFTKHPARHAAAAASIVVLWVPLCIEAAQGAAGWIVAYNANPLRLPLDLAVELMAFTPLTLLLLLLVRAKPWRVPALRVRHDRAGAGDEYGVERDATSRG